MCLCLFVWLFCFCANRYYSTHALTQTLLYLREELRACDDPNSIRKGKVPLEMHERLLELIRQADRESTTVRDDGVTQGSTKQKLFREQYVRACVRACVRGRGCEIACRARKERAVHWLVRMGSSTRQHTTTASR